MTTEHTLQVSDLLQFTGTELWYRHSQVRKVRYTDGVKHVAEKGGAYWLLDIIAFSQILERSVFLAEFQVWTLKVHPDKTAILTCEDGNKNEIFRQELEYTDFPIARVILWYSNNTILLPSEW